MSESRDKNAVMEIIDRLNEIYSSISRKETGGSTLAELKQDLVDFRDVLTEFGTGMIRWGFDMAVKTPQASSKLIEIMSSVLGNSIPSSRQLVNTMILLVDLKVETTKNQVQDSKQLASIINTTLTGNGLIPGLKALREVIQKL